MPYLKEREVIMIGTFFIALIAVTVRYFLNGVAGVFYYQLLKKMHVI